MFYKTLMRIEFP